MTSLRDHLLSYNICSLAQIQEAAQSQVVMGGRLGTNLVELGHIDEQTLASSLAQIHNCPSKFGADLQPDHALIGLLRAEEVDRYNVIPFRKENRYLILLCLDPTDLGALDKAAFLTGHSVRPAVVPEFRFWELLRRCYGINRELRALHLDAIPLPEDGILDMQVVTVADNVGGFRVEVPPPPLPVLTGTIVGEAEPPPGAAPPSATAPTPPPLTDTTFPHLPGVPVSQETHGGAATPPPPPAPAVEPPLDPIDFATASDLLRDASERDAVAQVVLRFARSMFARTMLFTVQRDLCVGWSAAIDGVNLAAFKQVVIPLSEPSVFNTVSTSRSYFLGGLAKSRTNIEFLRIMGKQVPLSAFALPILMRERVVNIFYADAGHRQHCTSDIGELLILATKISQSYEALIQKKLRGA